MMSILYPDTCLRSKSRVDIGDSVMISNDQARELQEAIEKAFKTKLGFEIKPGDMVLSEFTDLPSGNGRSRRRESVGHSIVIKQFLVVNYPIITNFPFYLDTETKTTRKEKKEIRTAGCNRAHAFTRATTTTRK